MQFFLVSIRPRRWLMRRYPTIKIKSKMDRIKIRQPVDVMQRSTLLGRCVMPGVRLPGLIIRFGGIDRLLAFLRLQV
jgi:hypothetical protein